MGSADYNENQSHESDSQDEVDQALGPDPEAELARLQANTSRSYVNSKSVTSRLYHDGRRRAQLTQERLSEFELKERKKGVVRTADGLCGL